MTFIYKHIRQLVVMNTPLPPSEQDTVSSPQLVLTAALHLSVSQLVIILPASAHVQAGRRRGLWFRNRKLASSTCRVLSTPGRVVRFVPFIWSTCFSATSQAARLSVSSGSQQANAEYNEQSEEAAQSSAD